MTLQPGCRLTAAPHFRVEPDWPSRLSLGQGIDEEDGRFFPRPPWRPPTAAELALLTTAPGAPELQLFALPEHLRSFWWQLLEQAGQLGAGPLPGFDDFLARVDAFLAFKQLPVPAALRGEAVVGRAGQRSLRWDAEACRPAGLAPSADAATRYPLPPDPPRLWGGVNLGDEATALVFLNLTSPQQEQELQQRGPGAPRPTSVGELGKAWLRTAADYPPVRLRLGPGEGVRLPDDGLILDGCPEDKREPDYSPVRLRLGPGEGVRLPDDGLILDGCPEDKREPDLWLMLSTAGAASGNAP
jgi:hypothetical protein